MNRVMHSPELIWSMLPSAFSQRVERVRAALPQIQAFAADGTLSEQPTDPEPQYEVRGNGVAVIDVVGVITKRQSCMGAMWGDEASTVSLRRALRAAVNDPQIRSILLYIDSPGGSVSGTADLADDIARANAAKPVTAYCSDLCASAAYWLASQCGKAYGNNATAQIGSIGTYAVLSDYSVRAAQEGVKVHVIKAGKFKGTGEPGAAITDDQLAEMQRTVEAVNAGFLSSVARGRRMSAEQVAALADGRVFVGAAAVAAGLIDGIRPVDDVMRELSNPPASGPSARASHLFSRGNVMPTEVPDPMFAAGARVRVKSSGEAGAVKESVATNLYTVDLDSGSTIQAAEADLEMEGDAAPTDAPADKPADPETAKAKPVAGAPRVADKADRMAALSAKHPAHAALVVAAVAAGKTDDQVEADVLRAELAAAKAENTALKARPAAGGTAAFARPDAKAPAKAKADADGVVSEEQFKADAALSREFAGSYPAYAAFTKAAAQGRVVLNGAH